MDIYTVNTSITSLFSFGVGEYLNIFLSANFDYTTTVLSTIVTMLHNRSSNLFPVSPAPSNHVSAPCFYEFDYFILFIYVCV